MSNNNKLILSFLILTIFILTTACNNNLDNSQTNEGTNGEIKELEEEIDNLNEQLENKNSKINALEEEKEFWKQENKQYNSMMDIIVPNLDDKELLELSKAAWDYELVVNEKQIPSDGYVEIDESDFKIAFREKLPPESLYEEYKEIFERGRLTDYDLNLISEDNLHEKSAGAGTVIDVPVVYTFKDLDNGSIIELEVSENLQERLGLDTKDIKVKVKK